MKHLKLTLATALMLVSAISLTAQEGTVKDQSGIEYPTVTIGSQVWIAENLRVEEVNCEGRNAMSAANGSESGEDATFYDGKPHFAYYQNRPELEFGAIYNYSAVSNCKVCPEGYRIPAKADWEALFDHLGGMSEAGAKLKRGGSSGFSGDMMGRYDKEGSVLEGKVASWWGIDKDDSGESKAYTIELQSDNTLRLIEQDNKIGNYVRCIKE